MIPRRKHNASSGSLAALGDKAQDDKNASNDYISTYRVYNIHMYNHIENIYICRKYGDKIF